MSEDTETEPVTLRRTITLPLLVLYGLGTMLGAGIYALIGEVAGLTGGAAPLAFLIAAGVASFTGASFAELSSRYPKAGGEAVYVREAFDSDLLSLGVGLLIIAAGTISSAVMFRSGAGYINTIFAAPDQAVILMQALLIGGLAIWGIGESIIAVAIITVIEAAALLMIVVLGFASPLPEASMTIPSGGTWWSAMLAAIVLAFYAFIGFEDMVNVSEEVIEPRRNMPIGIFIAIAGTALIYSAVTYIAVRAVPIEALANAPAPMTLVFASLSGWPGQWLSLVAVLAVANGALVQIIMASRVAYSLSQRRLLPAFLGQLNQKTQTPVAATLILCLNAVIATSWPLASLAQITTLCLLIVFGLVNLSLLHIKGGWGQRQALFEVPGLLPIFGALSSFGLALYAGLSLFR